MSRCLLPFSLIVVLGLAACADAPVFDRPVAAGPPPAGAAPAILPLDQLVAQAATPGVSATVGASVAARAARLRAKAAAMRGPVHDPETRARLAAAIAGRL